MVDSQAWIFSTKNSCAHILRSRKRDERRLRVSDSRRNSSPTNIGTRVIKIIKKKEEKEASHQEILFFYFANIMSSKIVNESLRVESVILYLSIRFLRGTFWKVFSPERSGRLTPFRKFSVKLPNYWHGGAAGWRKKRIFSSDHYQLQDDDENFWRCCCRLDQWLWKIRRFLKMCYFLEEKSWVSAMTSLFCLEHNFRDA